MPATSRYGFGTANPGPSRVAGLESRWKPGLVSTDDIMSLTSARSPASRKKSVMSATASQLRRREPREATHLIEGRVLDAVVKQNRSRGRGPPQVLPARVSRGANMTRRRHQFRQPHEAAHRAVCRPATLYRPSGGGLGRVGVGVVSSSRSWPISWSVSVAVRYLTTRLGRFDLTVVVLTAPWFLLPGATLAVWWWRCVWRASPGYLWCLEELSACSSA